MIREEVVELILGKIFGKKEHESVVRGGDIKIGDGVIQLWEQTMPLDAISMLNVTQLAPIPYIKPIIVLIVSVLLMFMVKKGKGFLLLTGIMAIAVLIVFSVLNQNRLYFLDIYNHMGYRIRLQHWNKSFLIELKEQIEKCLKNKGMNLVIHLNNEKIDINIEDVIMGEGRKYQAGGDITAEGGIKNESGNIISGTGNAGIFGSGNINQINDSGSIIIGDDDIISASHNTKWNLSDQIKISDEDWELIRRFAAYRKMDYMQGDKYYAICHNMQYCAQKKDKDKLVYWVNRVGKEAMTAVLSACTSEAVKNIINGILHNP